MLNGGNVYTYRLCHDTSTASMMQEPESGNHDAQCSSCLFSGDAKGSMLGTLKREQSLDQLRPYQIIRSWSPALITKIFHNLPIIKF